MTHTAPTFNQILARVRTIKHKPGKARAIGISAPGRWRGEPMVERDGERYIIMQCDSPLAMRLALRSEDTNEEAIKVLVTPLTDADLDDELRIRLARGKLYSLNNWEIVKGLFQAHTIDPRVARHAFLAEELMSLSPSEGYAPAAGGFLDAERAWSIILRERLGLTTGQPDLAQLLLWSTSRDAVRAWQQLPETLRTAATEWLAQSAGPAAEHVLCCIQINPEPEAVPIGLASLVMLSPQAGDSLQRAAGKMEERYFGGSLPEPAVLQRWASAARELVREQGEGAKLIRELLHRSDEILQEVGAAEYAHLSDVSPMGFDQRLARFGQVLSDLLETEPSDGFTSAGVIEPLRHAHESVNAHIRSRMQPEQRRIERLEMAIRLLRWMDSAGATTGDDPGSLGNAARYHLAEGGFVDWARATLRTGDAVRELSTAYSRLFERVTDIRERQARRFAELLRDWTAAGAGGDEVLPVEEVLEQIIAPLAAEVPVLMIVIDGMSAAVWRELLADLTFRGDWMVLHREMGTGERPVIATVPSVTELSRTSLLCGRWRAGGSNDEQKGFSENPALSRGKRSEQTAQLFHKPLLQDADDAVLTGEVRKAIETRSRRVVGVVLNAVDDHLLKGEQIDVRWTQEQIKPLGALLYEAASAGRVVVLASDHGHILDHGTKGTTCEDAGERWRPDDGQPGEGELAVKGKRVGIHGEGAVICPWTEKLRYGVKKNGYHGGVTPQEMVVPLTVLASGRTLPAGWQEAVLDEPAWWNGEPEAMPVQPSPAPSTPPRQEPAAGPLFEQPVEVPTARPATPQGAQPTDKATPTPPEPPESPDWINRLLGSALFQEQKKLGGRHVPADEVFTRVLSALDQRGGKMTTAALARILQRPPHRLSGLVAVLQRVLNIDGYQVLRRDEVSDTVEFDRDLLLQQFDLKS